ncbi:MAG: hypothetical protein IPP55_06695 [Anaerolineales bacterium]|nr:hypothetical protein [Anaerolineales bacterium]
MEESAAGWMYLDSTDLELIHDSDNQIVGIRFNGVNIPNGAIITNAYIKFAVDETTSAGTSLSIQGESSPNAAAFTGADRNVSSRARTANAVSWAPASWLTLGAYQQTPNLAPVLQEIVNQAGWASGNSMVFMFTGSGSRVAIAFETNPAQAPLLHFEFTMNASPSNTPTATFTALPSATPTASPTFTFTPVMPTFTFTFTPIIPTFTSTFTPMPVYTDTPIPTTQPSEVVPIEPSATPEAPIEVPTEVPPTEVTP